MLPLPPLSDHPGAVEYFWYQLPWAVPGMLTFTVGLSLSVIGLLSLRRNENRPLLVTFSLFCFGIGILGLLLAFRAIVLNLDILHCYRDWKQIGRAHV